MMMYGGRLTVEAMIETTSPLHIGTALGAIPIVPEQKDGRDTEPAQDREFLGGRGEGRGRRAAGNIAGSIRRGR